MKKKEDPEISPILTLIIVEVKIKVGKLFLNLINMHFPANSKLSKIFKKNTVKLSYSWLPSIKNFINGHNQQYQIRKIQTLKIAIAKTVIVAQPIQQGMFIEKNLQSDIML